MKLVKDPAEQTTAVTDIILSLVAFGGVLLLQWPPVYTGGLWRIHIWSTAIGLMGLAAVLGAVAHGLILKTITHNRIWRVLNLARLLRFPFCCWGHKRPLQHRGCKKSFTIYARSRPGILPDNPDLSRNLLFIHCVCRAGTLIFIGGLFISINCR